MAGTAPPAESIFPIKSLRRLERLLCVPREELRFLADAAEHHYRPFDRFRPRADGTVKVRHIDNPVDRLKSVQARINSRLLRTVPFPATMIGGVRRRGPRDGASLHCASPDLVTLDLSNCYPRTTNRQVFAVFRNTLGCSEEVARLLTRLTTRQGHLPQGAPTSGLLSNLCLLDLHQTIAGLAASRGLAFSQYVDDFALSGPGARNALGDILPMFFGHASARLNRSKLRCCGRGSRQEVTGICVNRRTMSARGPKYEALRNRVRSFDPNASDAGTERQAILGAIAHVRSINQLQADSVVRLAERCGLRRDGCRDTPDSVRPVGRAAGD
ncbi:MAG: RNA-directed DNA polymerase [Acidobacteria bacterium]|nr:RNA-directed DNA polymerase [Acidobacteriota bacterium]